MDESTSRREPKNGPVARTPSRLVSVLMGVMASAVALVAGYQLTNQITESFRVSATTTSRPAPPSVDLAPAVDPIEELQLEVQSGDTLDSLFRDTSLSTLDLAEIMQLDVARKYLRVLRPGDVLVVRHDGGQILQLDRELDIRTKLEVQRDGAGFQASVIEMPIESRIVMAAGQIRSSLFEAAQEARISEKLIMNVAQIFAYDIDFVRDIGAGDEFAVVYEELWRDGVKLGEGGVLAAEFMNRGARFTAIRYQDADDRSSYYTHDGQPMRKAFVRAPLSFTRISSGFNPARRHPILNSIRAHQGVDYAAPKGAPVKASGDGRVIFRGWKGGYGNTIILQHGGNVTTLYGHLSKFGGRGYGSRVQQGDVIGYVGATGLATAPHLHYEYRKNGVHLDPRTVILPNAEPLRGQALTAFRASAEPLLQRLEGRTSMLAANRAQ